jgi:hypothetical protein
VAVYAYIRYKGKKPKGGKTMGKICKDELVGKLAPLFRDADTDIDEAVKEAKNQLAAGAKKAKRKDLEKLFDSQIQTLKDRGCPEEIIELLTERRGSVLSRASKMTFEDGHIPIIPVIPRTYRSPYDLMAMVRNGNKQGYTYLNPTAITDKVETPDKPYYIFDVEDGKALLGKSPKEAEEILKKQSRSPLTVAEVMALTTHTDVLKEHCVWATGSRYGGSDRGVPAVYLGVGAQPKLDWNIVNDSYGRWGSASCGSRIDLLVL